MRAHTLGVRYTSLMVGASKNIVTSSLFKKSLFIALLLQFTLLFIWVYLSTYDNNFEYSFWDVFRCGNFHGSDSSCSLVGYIIFILILQVAYNIGYLGIPLVITVFLTYKFLAWKNIRSARKSNT